MLGPGFVPMAADLGITVNVLSEATAWLILTLGICVFAFNPLAKICKSKRNETRIAYTDPAAQNQMASVQSMSLLRSSCSVFPSGLVLECSFSPQMSN